jgi:hypothetical protein
MSSEHESSKPLLSLAYSFSNRFNPNASRNRRITTGLVLIVVTGFIFPAADLYQGLQIIDILTTSTKDTTSGTTPVYVSPSTSDKISIPNNFHTLFSSLRHPITADSYTDIQGNTFSTRGNGPWWTEPLSNQIIVADIDTRLPSGPNELWNDGRLDWEKVQNYGNGI